MCLVILTGWLIYWGRGTATKLYLLFCPQEVATPGVNHTAYTGKCGIVAVDPAHGPSLDHFNLIYVGLSEGANTVDAYSTWGRIRVWYAAVRIAVFLVLMFIFKKPSVLFAFVKILFMWVFQLRSLLMSTPRYLAWSMTSSACPCNMYMCWAGCLDFEMCNTWHLLGKIYVP